MRPEGTLLDQISYVKIYYINCLISTPFIPPVLKFWKVIKNL